MVGITSFSLEAMVDNDRPFVDMFQIMARSENQFACDIVFINTFNIDIPDLFHPLDEFRTLENLRFIKMDGNDAVIPGNLVPFIAIVRLVVVIVMVT
jgi:hypothetical protein